MSKTAAFDESLARALEQIKQIERGAYVAPPISVKILVEKGADVSDLESEIANVLGDNVVITYVERKKSTGRASTAEQLEAAERRARSFNGRITD